METPKQCVEYIISRSELSDTDFENNQYGISIHMKNQEEVYKINSFLKKLDKTKQLVDKVKFFIPVDNEQYCQLIIKPDLSIIVFYTDDKEVLIGEKYSFTEMEELMNFIFINKINYGTINNTYTY
jgi:hypothetical protein